MCGIAVLWGGSERGVVEAMLDRLAHRGPDGQRLHAVAAPPFELGHRRLAIIDPVGGAQPLLCPERAAALVANGMIYNDKALRARHADAPWRTGSDCESILHAVLADGAEAVAGLDGMFAFVMVAGDRLIAARDPLGKKPLYMARLGEALAFASEIKALEPLAGRIEAFPAGHLLDGERGLRPYWRVPAGPPSPWNVADAAAALRETLERAVVKRLRSDVPLGAFLSGGLDSSIICALARRHLAELHTFAVGLAGSRDLAAARIVAAHLGTRHHEIVLRREEALAALPDILWHLESFDRDLVRSAVPTWFVAREAARRVKVVLTGEGADELLAGYRYHAGYEDDAALDAELRRSLAAMHDINLQRVDRMSMAHGLEARVPFLDREVLALALDLPPALKRRAPDGRAVEKWILRHAFADLLPPEIVWRTKVQFDEGSGLADLLADEAERRWGGSAEAEERHYRDLLAARFAHPERVLPLVTHWRERRVAQSATG